VTLRKSILIVLIAATSLHAQQPKNVKILTGLSRSEVQRVMNEMRAGLGVHCHYCHVAGQDASVDATPQKARAREMMQMVIDINQRNFSGRNVVTCFTCHNGSPHPAFAPPLPQALPRDLPANPPPAADAKKPPSASDVLQKYIAAVGRIIPASEPRTIIATRSALGGPVATKIQESGEQLRVDVTLPDGSALTQVVSGAGNGWIRDKSGVRDLNVEDLANARMSRRPYAPFAETSFPDDATVTPDRIGDQNVWVVATPNARYSFDAESGFLLRRIVYYDSPMGRIPEQTEFDHYRDVGGAKVPFTTRVALVDPWLGSTRHATSIVIGKAIPAAEFAKP
jgi:hypothetical protein